MAWRRQGISSHGSDLDRPEYTRFSTRNINKTASDKIKHIKFIIYIWPCIVEKLEKYQGYRFDIHFGQLIFNQNFTKISTLLHLQYNYVLVIAKINFTFIDTPSSPPPPNPNHPNPNHPHPHPPPQKKKIYLHFWSNLEVIEYKYVMYPLRCVIITLRPRQNGRHFPVDIFKCISLNENLWISIKISLKFVPKGPINKIPALVQMRAWRRSGD